MNPTEAKKGKDLGESASLFTRGWGGGGKAAREEVGIVKSLGANRLGRKN